MSNLKYEPLDAMEYPRFCGIPSFMRLPHNKDLKNADFAIVGVPFDTGATFRVGARFGPEGIRQHSRLLRPFNPVLDVNLFEHLSGIDYGDLSIIPGYTKDSFEAITQGAAKIFKENIVPIYLGGDHSISYPLLRAAAEKHGKLALVHFDSHSDLWEGYFGDKDMNGTPFRRALENDLIDVEHSIQIGLRGPLYDKEDAGISESLGFQTITAPELHDIGYKEAIRQIQERVGDRKVYVTFDIDFVDPAYAPGTGTPEVGGFTGHEALQLVRGLTGLDIVAYDLVEVMPAYDPAHTTCLLAANLVYEFISLIAKRKSLIEL
jgi:agmatinase